MYDGWTKNSLYIFGVIASYNQKIKAIKEREGTFKYVPKLAFLMTSPLVPINSDKNDSSK